MFNKSYDEEDEQISSQCNDEFEHLGLRVCKNREKSIPGSPTGKPCDTYTVLRFVLSPVVKSRSYQTICRGDGTSQGRGVPGKKRCLADGNAVCGPVLREGKGVAQKVQLGFVEPLNLHHLWRGRNRLLIGCRGRGRSNRDGKSAKRTPQPTREHLTAVSSLRRLPLHASRLHRVTNSPRSDP